MNALFESLAVVVAHPDDEVLACGGAIARATETGSGVHILILATGATARDSNDRVGVEVLRDQAHRAAETLGASPPTFADFPDNRMDSVPLLDVVQRVEAFLAEAGAASVLTHHAGDLNVDHRVTAQAVLTACRPLPGAPVRRILAGEVPSSTEWADTDNHFRPTRYIEIASVLERKLAALACYEGEIREFPHPRSIEAVRSLAQWRGAEVGLAAAEAYRVVHEIDD